METKHTQGPWTLASENEIYCFIEGGNVLDGKPGVLATVVKTGDDFSKANARLIAAAPGLLEACKVAEQSIRLGMDLKRTCEELLAIISKAEGGA